VERVRTGYCRGETFSEGYLQAHRPDLIEELRL
jgi:hypothetical protein